MNTKYVLKIIIVLLLVGLFSCKIFELREGLISSDKESANNNAPSEAVESLSPILILNDFNNGTAQNNLEKEDFVWVQDPCTIEPVYNDKSSPHEGAYSLKINYDTKKTGGGAWITYPGSIDTSKYKWLQFWVKGEKGGETFAVEIKDAKEAKSKLNIKDYLDSTTTRWQKVSIPMSDFASTGEGNPDMSQIIAVALVWWEELSLPVSGTVYVDKIMLVRDEKIIKNQKGLSSDLVLDDFNNGTNQNNLQQNDAIWAQDPGIITTAYNDKSSPYEGTYNLKIDYDTKSTGGGAWMLITGTIDISKYKSLEFWVKGKNGGENFAVELRDSNDVKIKFGINNFINKVTTEWQKVNISIDEIKNSNSEIDLAQITVIGFVWWEEYSLPVKGTIYLDKVMLKK